MKQMLIGALRVSCNEPYSVANQKIKTWTSNWYVESVCSLLNSF